MRKGGKGAAGRGGLEGAKETARRRSRGGRGRGEGGLEAAGRGGLEGARKEGGREGVCRRTGRERELTRTEAWSLLTDSKSSA